MGDNSHILWGLLVAIAGGALVGLERQRRIGDDPHGFGGIRTFPLVSLSGALAGLFVQSMGPWPVVAGAVVLGALLVTSTLRNGGDGGMTTEVAALAIFLLGVLATTPGLPVSTTQRYLLVVAGSAVVMGLLSFKEPLHRVAARMTADDLYATAKFIVLAAVVLPLLPDRTFGPLDILNPFNIGTMVALVAAIGFVGYVAARLIGPDRGLAVTGLVGGLVSSTAVTVSLSQRVKHSPQLVEPAAVAIVTASSTMFARVLVVVGFVAPGLLPALAPRLGAMAAVGFAAAVLLFMRDHRPKEGTGDVPLQNPFAIKEALQFGLLYGAVIFLAELGHRVLGEGGLYLTSLVAGTTDVDAITLSMSRLFGEGLDPTVAARAIVLATAANTLVKVGMAAYFGGKKLAMRLGAALGAALVAGGIASLF